MPIEQITKVLIWIVMWGVVLFLLGPLVVVIGASFSASPVFNFPPEELSLRWYGNMAQLNTLLPALKLSVEIALLSTAISLVLGTLCAIAIVRTRFPGRSALTTFMVSPLMMPGLVVGIAMLQFFRLVGLFDAYPALLIGHVVITMPYVMRTVLAGLSLFDFTYIDAARVLGYSYPMAILRVLVPAQAPAFLTAGLFAFLASMDNYPIAIFLTDVRNKTLPIQMLQYIEESPDPTIAAISTGLIALTVVVLILGDRLVGLRRLASM